MRRTSEGLSRLAPTLPAINHSGFGRKQRVTVGSLLSAASQPLGWLPPRLSEPLERTWESAIRDTVRAFD